MTTLRLHHCHDTFFFFIKMCLQMNISVSSEVLALNIKSNVQSFRKVLGKMTLYQKAPLFGWHVQFFSRFFSLFIWRYEKWEFFVRTQETRSFVNEWSFDRSILLLHTERNKNNIKIWSNRIKNMFGTEVVMPPFP